MLGAPRAGMLWSAPNFDERTFSHGEQRTEQGGGA
jgi:hypothetical protein